MVQHNLSARATLFKNATLKFIKTLKNVILNLKGQCPLNLKKIYISGGDRGNHKLSIDTT
jgi:hypothetical protein